MFRNIGNTIKNLAVVLLFVGLIGGMMWLLYSINQYIEYKDFLDYYYDSTSEYYQKALFSKNGLLLSVIIIVCSVISTLLMYGFGEMIEHLKNIDDNLNGYNENDNGRPFKTAEEVFEELEKKNDSSYIG